MNEQERRVYNKMAEHPEGATILDLSACGLWPADVARALGQLKARRWVEQRGELFFQVSPRAAANVDLVIAWTRSKNDDKN